MPPSLAELTTLRLGGPIAALTTAATDDELVDAVCGADAAGEAVLLVGGGSNLVAADEGWPGRVVLVRTRGVTIGHVGKQVRLTASAGEPWDALVRWAVAEGWSGLETMAGIPGLTGATPVQNVGAYGAEIADVLTGLTVLDRRSGAVEKWTPEQCRFGFRTSVFKHTEHYVVLDVTLTLTKRTDSVPIHYTELARRLDIEPGRSASPGDVSRAVLALRRAKGMVLDAADPDTWSVGSFFVNPLVDIVPKAARDCPQWQTDGATKLSAAWLIERAGFPRGYGGPTAAVSGKHSLALTNRGGATTAELLTLAREIQAGVETRFGVRLRPEARLAPNVPSLN